MVKTVIAPLDLYTRTPQMWKLGSLAIQLRGLFCFFIICMFSIAQNMTAPLYANAYKYIASFMCVSLISYSHSQIIKARYLILCTKVPLPTSNICELAAMDRQPKLYRSNPQRLRRPG